MCGKAPRPLVELGQGLARLQPGHVNDQRVETRPAFGGKDRGDGAVVGRIRTQPVDGLGRESDELSRAQPPGSAFDRRRSCANDPIVHRATIARVRARAPY
jgi:hypothetical protein